MLDYSCRGLCTACSAVLDKYKTSTAARRVETILRVEVSVRGIKLTYRSSRDQSTHQLNIIVNIPLRSWTHIALQVALLALTKLHPFCL